MSKGKHSSSRRRHEFLLTFFSDKEKFAEKEVNGYVLVKYFNNGSKKWEVMIYTPESHKKAKEYMKNKSFFKTLNKKEV